MNNSIRDKWCEKEISDLDYIRHLEAENAKLKEPKTCDGCEYAMLDPNGDVEDCSSEERCIRYFAGVIGAEDCYEPKEQQ